MRKLDEICTWIELISLGDLGGIKIRDLTLIVGYIHCYLYIYTYKIYCVYNYNYNTYIYIDIYIYKKYILSLYIYIYNHIYIIWIVDLTFWNMVDPQSSLLFSPGAVDHRWRSYSW